MLSLFTVLKKASLGIILVLLFLYKAENSLEE